MRKSVGKALECPNATRSCESVLQSNVSLCGFFAGRRNAGRLQTVDSRATVRILAQSFAAGKLRSVRFPGKGTSPLHFLSRQSRNSYLRTIHRRQLPLRDKESVKTRGETRPVGVVELEQNSAVGEIRSDGQPMHEVRGGLNDVKLRG